MTDRRRRDPVKTEARRHQILEAAAECFRQYGFRGASMAEISKAAGMSTGHIYHYFSCKEALVEAIVQRDQTHGIQLMEELQASLDIGTLVVEESAERMVERPHKSCAGLMVEIYAEAARNPIVHDIVLSSAEAVRTVLLDTLRKGQRQGSVDPSMRAEDLQRILFFIYDGLTAYMALNPDFDRDEVKQTLRLLLERLLPKPAAA